MASDWIKLRVDIFRDPSVLRMSDICRTNRHQIVGQLSDVWGWIDGHTVDGSCPNISTTMLDAYIGMEGFAAAMVAVGWLKVDGEGVLLPKWERHNSMTAKARALENEAKRLRRNNVGQVSDKTSDKVSIKRPTREEKRREEKNTPKPPRGQFAPTVPAGQFSPALTDALNAWAKHRREKKKPITESQWELLLKQAATEPDFTTKVHHSIAQGYQGLYAPNGSEKPKQGTAYRMMDGSVVTSERKY